MKPTVVLEPWQVTGVDKAIEVYDTPGSKCIILADAMGLGKTHQMMSFMQIVS